MRNTIASSLAGQPLRSMTLIPTNSYQESKGIVQTDNLLVQYIVENDFVTAII